MGVRAGVKLAVVALVILSAATTAASTTVSGSLLLSMSDADANTLTGTISSSKVTDALAVSFAQAIGASAPATSISKDMIEILAITKQMNGSAVFLKVKVDYSIRVPGTMTANEVAAKVVKMSTSVFVATSNSKLLAAGVQTAVCPKAGVGGRCSLLAIRITSMDAPSAPTIKGASTTSAPPVSATSMWQVRLLAFAVFAFSIGGFACLAIILCATRTKTAPSDIEDSGVDGESPKRGPSFAEMVEEAARDGQDLLKLDKKGISFAEEGATPQVEETRPRLLQELEATTNRLPDQTAIIVDPMEDYEIYGAGSGSGSGWEQIRERLHAVAMRHAKEELQKRWEDLEWESKSMDPSTLKNFVMPYSGSPRGSPFAVLQEQYTLWYDLSSAISRESLFDLRQALDQCAMKDLSAGSRAIILTYADALSRHRSTFRFTTDEVMMALERGIFEQALDMVIEMATEQGADVGLVLTWLTRLCADWNSRIPAASPSILGNVKYGSLDLYSQPEPAEIVGSLVLILHGKASRHARLELNKTWDALDSAFAPSAADRGQAKGGIGPEYAPLSKAEESFYIRTKIVNAIQQQSLLELRRALSYALASGIDPEHLEVEVAYRDALAKHQQADGFAPQHLRDPLERGDWWSVLDIIIGAALASGVDKDMLQRTIGTYQSRAGRQAYERDHRKGLKVSSV